MLSDLWLMLKRVVGDTIGLDVRHGRDLWPIKADVGQLEQVIVNLAVNARDAMKPGGKLTLRTRNVTEAESRAFSYASIPKADYVLLEVEDTGTGIPQEFIDKIFDPFFTTKFTGRGLGLAATLGIMRGHRGAIRVYSEPRKGTSMKLCFPITDRSVRPEVSIPATPWTGDGEVLVVDDEPSVRAVTRALLHRRGFTVCDTESGAEAIELVRAAPDRFRVVLLDLTMPGMNGEQTFRELRRLATDVKVILMSGYNEQEVTRLFVGRGLAAVLQKPFRAEDLDAAIQRVLGFGAVG